MIIEQNTRENRKEIFDLLYRASGDGILENKEFEKKEILQYYYNNKIKE